MRPTTFAGCGVLPELVGKVGKSLGAVNPTCVQRKSLPVVLDGRNAVINAETGSGKTLCFLLPVLQNLIKLAAKGFSAKIPSPYSLALAPTPHLANQINSVFLTLADPQWGSTVVHKGSRMLLKPNTYFLVGTPTSIAQYDILEVFRHVRIVCIDEADVLLTGTEQKATWEILKLVKRLHREDRERSVAMSHDDGEYSSVSSISRQMIFTAATLPSGGPQTVHSLLQKWLPKDTYFIATEETHQIVSMAKTTFVDIHDQAETSSNTGAPPLLRQGMVPQKLATLYSDLKTLGKEAQQPKVLVFANTVAGVKTICGYLTRQASDEVIGDEEASYGGTAGEWWGGGATKELHKGVPPEEREETLRQFREGAVRVLICTDLASRGLDLPDITAVIQFDFPGNSADYLHRAGRTARAGREGAVIAYVCDSDQDLAWEIQQVLADRSKSFASIFSRNKMLRRKMKARKTIKEN